MVKGLLWISTAKSIFIKHDDSAGGGFHIVLQGGELRIPTFDTCTLFGVWISDMLVPGFVQSMSHIDIT